MQVIYCNDLPHKTHDHFEPENAEQRRRSDETVRHDLQGSVKTPSDILICYRFESCTSASFLDEELKTIELFSRSFLTAQEASFH